MNLHHLATTALPLAHRIGAEAGSCATFKSLYGIDNKVRTFTEAGKGRQPGLSANSALSKVRKQQGLT